MANSPSSLLDTSAAAELLEGPQKFYRDSLHILQRCTKPDMKGKQNTKMLILFRIC